jgi:CheY-like chemotaxis protein
MIRLIRYPWRSRVRMPKALPFVVLAMLVALAACPVLAQDDDADFADDEAAAAAPDANAPASQSGTSPAAPVTSPEVQETVRALLETNPSTPDELVRAVDILLNLGHPQDAQPLVKRLLDMQPDQATLAGLGRKFGTATFLKISLQPELRPEGLQLADAVRLAVEKESRDPQRLAQLVGDLTDPSAAVRRRAKAELRRGGSHSAAFLLTSLAGQADEDGRRVLRDAIVAQGEAAIGPLEAALEASDPLLRAQAAECLGRIGAKSSATLLLAPALSPESPDEVRQSAQAALDRLLGRVPTEGEAAATLYRAARHHYDAQNPLNPDAENLVEVWHWDDAQGAPVSKRMLADDATLRIAARLSGDLFKLMPDSRQAQRLFLGSRLEAASYEAGLDQPLPQGPGTAHDDAVRQGPDAVEDLLSESLTDGHPRAATAAARILGEIGSAEMLARQSPRPSALVRALQTPDPRLRFAALEAIMRLAPAAPFPGSSHVVDALAFFARSGGAPRVLVGDTRTAEGLKLAGLLGELGYDAEVTNDGRDFLLRAAVLPYDMLLIDIHLPRLPVEQVLQQLRRDPGNGGVPIGLVGPLGAADQALGFGRGDRLSLPLARATDRRGMEFQVGQLLQLVGRNRMTDAERDHHAALATAWLSMLAAEPVIPYDLTRAASAMQAALDYRELAGEAIKFLQQMGQPQAQRALVDLASRAAEPIAQREAAAEAFRQSVMRFGTLLTIDEIELQYERYNASEVLDKDTQRVLGFLLDILEAGREPPADVAQPANPAPPDSRPAAP